MKKIIFLGFNPLKINGNCFCPKCLINKKVIINPICKCHEKTKQTTDK